MLKSGIELVRSAFGGGIPPVGQAEAVLLVEVAGDHGVDDELAAACAGIAAFLCVEPAVAIGSSARAGLWRWREEHTAAIATLGVPLKMDVSLPHRNISAFLAALGELDLPSVPIVFGHLGDGNLHVNVPNCMAEEGSGHRVAPNVEEIERTILQLVVSFGGSISAEHGIGVAKAHYLSMTRSPSEIATFRAIKRAFDPGNVLNPGVLLPVTIDKVSPPPVSSHDAQEVSPHREPT